jgi:hypothetical protein
VCGCELAQGLFLAIGARRSQSSLKLPSRSRSLLSRRHLSAAVALADADNLDKPILRLFLLLLLHVVAPPAPMSISVPQKLLPNPSHPLGALAVVWSAVACTDAASWSLFLPLSSASPREG